jgi:hypothetical protein
VGFDDINSKYKWVLMILRHLPAKTVQLGRVSSNGLDVKLTPSTSVFHTSAPNFFACVDRSSISSGPVTAPR